MNTMRLRLTMRAYVSRYPWLYFPLLHLVRSPRRYLHVRRDTEIAIEGYPRSANTFAVCAFLFAQGRPVKIARHLHAPAQIMLAVRWGIPMLVLMRRPEDAILSLLVREPALSAGGAVRAYIRFYQAVQALRKGVVLATFESVTRDFGRVIMEVNRKFATQFVPFFNTKENVEQVLRMVDDMDRVDQRREAVTIATVARPTGKREAMKERKRGDLCAVESLLCKATQLYESLAATAEAR